MRTMGQVWILVALPFIGLLIISGLIFGLLGLGNYRYDTNPNSKFAADSCFVWDSKYQNFSQYKSSYSSNCLPTFIKCYEVVWNVTYNNTTGIIYSSGVSDSAAKSLLDEYKVNNSYPCWHLHKKVVSWKDWSPTKLDLKIDVHMMIIGGSVVASLTIILLILVVVYIRIGREWPFVFDTVGYERLS